ncbi:DNA-binding helix-turn-helix protein [Subdoligranulum variabile DSM 15176]|uniref:DNA-binding helix-turn-helix protein n=2 Tax=Subdoligranulum variabile TaxID=214851 RepID=D1PN26_9FIRM|nr:DNA-binding helix-turn-helix protein [Subdoligranulum variabile DSM 15176]
MQVPTTAATLDGAKDAFDFLHGDISTLFCACGIYAGFAVCNDLQNGLTRYFSAAGMNRRFWLTGRYVCWLLGALCLLLADFVLAIVFAIPLQGCEVPLFSMLSQNLKTIRKSKGLSQQELAVKLNVVRQTISKWEQGLSVPDSEMLISISEVLETPVSILLGENVVLPEADTLKAISEKLEVINLQMAQKKNTRRKIIHWSLIGLCAIIMAIFVVLYFWKSPYQAWNYADPETAVLGVAFHSLEWLFVRVAPLAFVGAIIGIVLTRKKS